MEELKKEEIHKKFHIKGMKEEVSDSDDGNKLRLFASQDFGEISVKEEVSDEFHSETSSSINFDVFCAKSENSLPNTTTEMLQQDLYHEKDRKLSPSRNLEEIQQLLPQTFHYDPTLTGDVYSRSGVPIKCAQSNCILSQPTSKNTIIQDGLRNSANGTLVPIIEKPVRKSQTNKKRKTNDQVDDAFLEWMNMKKSANSDQDVEQHFLLSLLPDLKNLSSRRKRDFKIQTMSLLHKFLEEDERESAIQYFSQFEPFCMDSGTPI